MQQLEVLKNHIIDTDFPEQLQKVESERQLGPLTINKKESSVILWTKTTQAKIQDTPQCKDDAEKLNFQLDEAHRIYICMVRITGDK